MRVVHIEAKRRIPEADAATLMTALAGHVGRDLTPADTSVLTGLPLDSAEAGLIALAGRYPSRLRVTETGGLVFRFHSFKRARGSGAWAAVARRVLAPLIAAATLLMGPLVLASLTRDVAALGLVAWDSGWFWLACIPCLAVGTFAALGAVMTFLSFILMPLMGIGMAAAGVTLVWVAVIEDGDAGGKIFGLVLATVMLVLGWKATRWGAEVWIDNVWKKPTWARALWRGTIDVLMGPARAGADALHDERRLAVLIRERRGVLALSDLIGLFGWTPAEADAQIARILSDYGGDVVLTDDGAIVYAFDDPNAVSGPGALTGSLLATAGEVAAAPAGGGSRGERAERFLPSGGMWVLMGALGLGALGVLLYEPLPLWPTSWSELTPRMPALGEAEKPMHLFGLGLWPYAVLYGALALRAPSFIWRRVQTARRARLDRYLEVAARRPAGAPFAGADLGVVAALGGDYDGATLSFPELAGAAAAAEKMRAGAEVGRVAI